VLDQEKAKLPALSLNKQPAHGAQKSDPNAAVAGGNEDERASAEREGSAKAFEDSKGGESNGFVTSYLRCAVKNLKIVSVGANLRKRYRASAFFFFWGGGVERDT